MEKFHTPASRFWLVLTLLVASLLLCSTHGDDEVEDPRKNVNLSPFEKWRSVGECLRNTSQSCGRYNLKIDGWMNVTSTDTEEFCRVGGCKEHTFAVLACIRAVKSDIHFGNKATLQDLDHTIAHGCSHRFTGNTWISSSGRSTSKSRIVFAATAALVTGLLYDGIL